MLCFVEQIQGLSDIKHIQSLVNLQKNLKMKNTAYRYKKTLLPTKLKSVIKVVNIITQSNYSIIFTA